MNTQIDSTISLPFSDPIEDYVQSAVISVTEIKENGQPTLDLIAACATYNVSAPKLNVWAIVTSANSFVESEYAITSTTDLYCIGVNTVSESAIYVVIEVKLGELGLITMDAGA